MPRYRLDGVEPSVHPDAYVHPDAVLIGDVHIGAESTVWPGAVLRADYGPIYIGERTSIQDGTVLHTTAEWPTRIGSDVVVGHATHLEGCTVGDWVLIGSGSTVLNRASVENWSIVAAGALIREDDTVPTGHLAVGVPASMKPLTKDHAPYMRHSVSSYVENGRRYRQGLELIEEDSTAGTAS